VTRRFLALLLAACVLAPAPASAAPRHHRAARRSRHWAPVLANPGWRWPCHATVAWTVDPDGLTPQTVSHFVDAFDQATAATGIGLHFAGYTQRATEPIWVHYDPHTSYAPATALAAAAAQAGHTAFLPAAAGTYDSGEVIALQPDLTLAVALHEVGHVMGLGHAGGPDDVMAHAERGQARYGPTDLAGLAEAAPCGGRVP
jgi:hypothetical protein